MAGQWQHGSKNSGIQQWQWHPTVAVASNSGSGIQQWQSMADGSMAVAVWQSVAVAVALTVPLATSPGPYENTRTCGLCGSCATTCAILAVAVAAAASLAVALTVALAVAVSPAVAVAVGG
jgi:hypothetical protein